LTKYKVYDTLYYDKIIQVTLSREAEGMGPMKPATGRIVSVPIPTGCKSPDRWG